MGKSRNELPELQAELTKVTSTIVNQGMGGAAERTVRTLQLLGPSWTGLYSNSWQIEILGKKSTGTRRRGEAKVIKRPKELAQDESSEWLAWIHAINFVHEQGYEFSKFISLPATAPLRADEDISNCLLALKGDVDVVITVTPANRNPSFNMVKRDTKGISELIIKSDLVRRQDAPLVYDMTTVAYVTSPQYILNKKNLFEGNTYSVIIPKERAVDIDDEIDFLLAEKLFERKNDFKK